MNMVYESTSIQGCKKTCHSKGRSCDVKIKKYYKIRPLLPLGSTKIWSGKTKFWYGLPDKKSIFLNGRFFFEHGLIKNVILI